MLRTFPRICSITGVAALAVAGFTWVTDGQSSFSIDRPARSFAGLPSGSVRTETFAIRNHHGTARVRIVGYHTC